MFKRTMDKGYQEIEGIELSRRSFFGRLAVGAALTVAAPVIAEAAKVKTSPGKPSPSKSAVRLPKQTSLRSAKNRLHHVKTTKTVQIHHSHYHGKHHGPAMHASYSPNREASHSILQSGLQEPWLTSNPDTERLAASAGFPNYRALAIKNPHTGDSLNLTYFEKGEYLSEALDEISYLLRDYRTGDVHPIDPGLLDQLHELKQMLDLNQPFHVICGYRSPATNAQLHAEHAGVASNSFHMYGRAVDVRIEGYKLRDAYHAAIAMHSGGVGYYPESNFIHLDTGTFRTWSL